MVTTATKNEAKPKPLDLITRAELAEIGHNVDVQMKASRINKREVGRLIKWAHDKLRGHYGGWATWLKAREISPMTAWNYEKLAERFKDTQQGADPKYREAGMYADMSPKARKKTAGRSQSGEVVVGAIERLSRLLRDDELMKKYPETIAGLNGRKREQYRRNVETLLEQLQVLYEQLEATQLVAV